MLSKYQPFVLRHALVLVVGSNHLLRVLGLYVQHAMFSSYVQHIAGDGEHVLDMAERDAAIVL